MTESAPPASLQHRIDEVFESHRRQIYCRTDRMFAVLLLLQWAGAVIGAYWMSPRTWAGTASDIHPHVWMALFLGGALCSLPVAQVWLRPGQAVTRYSISIAQILFSSLLIHISGGRIETHFHVFGSLAFLAAYRDWRLLILPTVITGLDHYVRELFWPETFYGSGSVSPWRWLEHALWVVFEDIFLIITARRSVMELRSMSEQTARRSLYQDHLEDLVAARTDELTSAKDAAEAANRAKSSFLANMSHEIRTPMTAIMGYAETLLEPDQTPSERHDALHVIRRSSRHLLDLIDDVLDISKIEAGKTSVEQVPIDLPQVAADVVSLLRPTAIAKGLALRLTFGDPIARTIQSDPVRVKQVLMNLVGNAIKFTQQGSVHLHVACEEHAGLLLVSFEVTDTGIGIQASELDRIFQPFSQADESTTRRFGGTGLGLIISRRLAAMLGGSLTVESAPAIGSTFLFTLTAGRAADCEFVHGLTESSVIVPCEELAEEAHHRLHGRILLAEDGLDNQKLISLQLRKAGAHVVIAENGRVAVERVASEPFDLVLMDMQMPVMDGYSATRELRERGHRLPIIAVTAHAMAEDREHCLAAGCTDYLTKPVEKERLLRIVSSYLPVLRAVDEDPPSDQACSPINGVHHAAGLRVTSRYAEDPEMRDLIEHFVKNLPERVATLSRLLEVENFAELQRVLHQLKGAGGGYGFDEITRLAAVAESDMDRGDPLDSIVNDVQSLISLVRSVEGYQPSQELVS